VNIKLLQSTDASPNRLGLESTVSWFCGVCLKMNDLRENDLCGLLLCVLKAHVQPVNSISHLLTHSHHLHKKLTNQNVFVAEIHRKKLSRKEN
jgi:hypothetical protein